ncbi:MAG: hypothetical protein AAB726_00795 [Patescibacteria group bacterium]
MKEDAQKVVKCVFCDKYFGYAEKNKNCPFCYNAYNEVVEKPKERKDLPAQAGRKVPVKTQKESFKIWSES